MDIVIHFDPATGQVSVCVPPAMPAAMVGKVMRVARDAVAEQLFQAAMKDLSAGLAIPNRQLARQLLKRRDSLPNGS
jgi:hypothetical protein